MHEDLHDEKLQELRKSLESDEIFENLALLFAAFSDSTRLKILSALSKEELCVHELSQILNIKQPSISQHLKLLWQSKIVKKRKVGLHVFYSFDDEHIKRIYKLGVEHAKE